MNRKNNNNENNRENKENKDLDNFIDNNNITINNNNNEKKENHIYEKEKGKCYNIKKCLELNKWFFSSIVIMTLIFGYVSNDYIRTILTTIIIFIWAYTTHILAHMIQPLKWFHSFHHDDRTSHTWYGELIETLVNIFGSGGLTILFLNIFLEIITGYKLLNNYVIFLFSFFYASYHMINYHILKVSTHVNHHKEVKTNYGPDIMDIIFNTKHKEDTEIENMNHGTINIIILTVLTLYMKDSKIDIIKYIEKGIRSITKCCINKIKTNV